MQNLDKVDGFVSSLVIDEISNELFQNFAKAEKNNIFTILNPSGFIRQWKRYLSISYKDKINLDISDMTLIKIDEEELSVFTKEITVVDRMKLLK